MTISSETTFETGDDGAYRSQLPWPDGSMARILAAEDTVRFAPTQADQFETIIDIAEAQTP